MPQALTLAAQSLGEAAKAALLSRLDFSPLLDQHGRLLQVHTALPTLALVPERMVMREAVGQPFELVLDCIASCAQFELKRLIGEQISLGLLQADGSYKPWHGYVFEAAQLGSDGGLARYRLVMRPWLSFLAFRRDVFVYQDLTALQIIEDVFADYPQANYRLDVTDELRLRSLCTQYRESDLEFVARLLAEEGLSYYFEHEAEGEVSAASGALHTLVITDRQFTRPDLGEARFTAQHAVANLAGQRDAVTAFATRRSLQANAVALGSWNYRQLAGTAADLSSALSLGELPTLEIYDGAGAYRYQNSAHAERAAELALAALELDVKQFEGQGSTRHFEAGRSFSLIDHPLYGANTTAFDDLNALLASHQRPDHQFTILAVEHHAANNLGAEAAQLLGATELERGSYKNHFHAAPAAAAIVPRFLRKPTAPGAQTAIVVGLAGEPLTTDRDHRVKIQFPWQRGTAPVAGGLNHEGSPDTDGNAPGDDSSGTWVRVAGPSAGANWGTMFTPRIGSEVLVDFIEGDVDRPVILGGLYNGADAPPFAAGVDSGTNHPGVISGLHTQSLDQSGANQWVLDDATAQLRMRLMTSATAAELSLGHLIQQGASGAHRGSWRGSGFEARTGAWGSFRAAGGLLITTSARAGSYGSAESTQMDAAESLAQLKSAQDLGQRLSQAAQAGTAQALHSHDAGASVAKFITSVDPAQDGKHPDQVNGQDAKKASGRELTDPVEAFAKPVIVLDTPSTLAWASDASIASFAGQDISLTAQGDHHEAAAHTHTTVAGGTASFYTHAGGIKAYAANGPLSLRAHTDELQILADQDVTVVSVNGEIHINAQSKIEIIGGDSSIVLDGGDITFTTPGTWAAKASAVGFLGGASAAAGLPALPIGNVVPPDLQYSLFEIYDEQFRLVGPDGDTPLVGQSYQVISDDGQVWSGTTDSDGLTARIVTDGPKGLRVEIIDQESPRVIE
jgi:type VI secretion system secreted protein VgrG